MNLMTLDEFLAKENLMSARYVFIEWRPESSSVALSHDGWLAMRRDISAKIIAEVNRLRGEEAEIKQKGE